MKEYKFDQTKDHVNETMGIDDARADEITGITKKAYMACTNQAETLEAAINAVQPESDMETLWIGYCVGNLCGRFAQIK